MKYIRMLWKHEDPDEPVVIFNEIDADQWEHRKVEVWANGRKGYADNTEEAGGTRLGIEPWEDGELEEMAIDPEFDVQYITKEEFEQVWAERSRL